MRRRTTSIAPQIIDEASEWFVTMREPSVTGEQRDGFAEWLRASPLHVRAYLDIARLWGDGAHVHADFPVGVDAESHAANVVTLHPSFPATAKGVGRDDVEPASKRRALRAWAGRAASFLLVCVLAGSAAWWYINRPPTYVAGIGEQRVITLDDGSTVRLNSRSKMTVGLTPALRQVTLLEGQALFEVAKDAARPFVVHSGDVTIRAVGTAFDVYRKPSGTVVTVVEGKVEVTTLRGGGGPLRHESSDSRSSYPLAAGEQAAVSPSGVIERQPKANIAAATSWLQQELVFDGQSLGAVVDEFNRYSRTPIVLSDPSLAELRINAVFHTTSPDSLLRFVTRYEGVEVERADGEIRISRRAQGESAAE